MPQERELSQTQLEELVNGKPAEPRAEFFEKAVLDTQASRKANRRIYRKAVYVTKTQPGVIDRVAELAQPVDFTKYPEEYQYFLNTKQGDKAASISIIPGLDIIHLTELQDFGLYTIKQLATADLVPPHLTYAQEAAVRIYQALYTQENTHEQEESNQEAQDRSDPGREAHRGGQQGADPVPVGRGHSRPVNGGRGESPRFVTGTQTQGRETEERPGAGRRVNCGESLTPNWEIQIG
jgi:hypothetical protein